MSINSNQATLDELILHQKIPDRHPELFPKNKWKWMVVNRANNGLSKAFSKVGRNLYVNERLLAECINEMHE